jgi:hypothetical protein
MNIKHRLALLAPLVAAASSQAAIITLTNADFQADVGQGNTIATGWVAVNGAGTNSTPSNYFANDVPNLIGNRVALIKSDGGNYIQQGVVLSDSGAVDATTFGQYTVDFNFGYRRDAVRNGDLSVRVSLWNTTDNVELAGQDFTLTDPLTTGANSLVARVASLSYDNTLGAYLGDSVALRVTSISADLAGSAWQRTGMVDGFAVTAVPEPSTYGLMGAGAFAVVAFVRRRKAARGNA